MTQRLIGTATVGISVADLLSQRTGLTKNAYDEKLEEGQDPQLLRASLTAADMALIAVPLVGFDGAGHRLGMGGGWYDRTLASRLQRPAPPWLVGVGFEAQRIEAVGAQAWDVPLDAICTERDTLIPSSSLPDAPP